MRKISYFFAVAIFSAAAFSGCVKDRVTDKPVVPEEVPAAKDPITITATIASTWSGVETRVGFDDTGTTVELTWTTDDCIAMYDPNGDFAAVFRLEPSCHGLKTGTFIAESGDITEGVEYTVIYPFDNSNKLSHRKGLADMATQNGNGSTSHLNDLCHMKATYLHSESAKVNFALEYAMLTLVIATPYGYYDIHGAPTALMVTDNSKSHTICLSGMATIPDPMTVYMLVEPMTGASRDLTFELTCINDTGSSRIFTMSTTTNIDYQAGKRYTADLSGSNVLSLPDSWELSDFNTTDYPPSPEDTWVVTDDIYNDRPLADFAGLRDALQSAANEGRNIRLVLPNAYEIPNADNPNGQPLFYDCFALVSVSLPQATVIGEYAFEHCGGLQSVDLPKVEEVSEGAFYECSSLTSITLPEAKTIGESAFDGSGITTANLPKAETIGMQAFAHCTNLQSADLPEATELSDGAFLECPGLKTADFPKVTKVGEEVFSKDTSLEYVNLPEATEVGSLTFSECGNLATILLPKVVSLGIDGTFNGCVNLERLEVATQSTGLTSTPTNLFANIPSLSAIGLYIGDAEETSPGTDVAGLMWRGYGQFGSITVERP